MLNKNNYYSLEANKALFSVSQYKDFLRCEAYAIAKINGNWEDESKDVFLIGSYVHAWNEGDIEGFKKENPSIFTKKQELKAEFKGADKMIKALEDDPMIMYTLEGEKEVIMVAEIGGVPWKIRVDTLNLNKGRFVDLKTVKDFKKIWNSEQRAYSNFIIEYGYDTQMALYQAVIEQVTGIKPDAYIVAVTKENVPDKAIITFDDDSLERELENIIMNVQRFNLVKTGIEAPIACGKCDYCKSIKKVSNVINYLDL